MVGIGHGEQLREQLQAKEEQLQAKDQQCRAQLQAKDEKLWEQSQQIISLLKAKDEQLREANHKLRKLENALAAEKDGIKGNKAKADGKHEESQREVSKQVAARNKFGH